MASTQMRLMLNINKIVNNGINSNDTDVQMILMFNIIKVVNNGIKSNDPDVQHKQDC
jgi:hypothetical protein